MNDNPILVEVTRANMVESFHHGRAVIVNHLGDIELSYGNVGAPIFPRSTIKVLQILPAFMSGAVSVDKFTPKEIAIGCASHYGEDIHVKTVQAILKKSGLSEKHLKCGARSPYSLEAQIALGRKGDKAQSLHNNCSGKHAMMLAQAKELGADLDHYIDITHPVQQSIMGALERVMEIDLSNAVVGYDGCSVPTWAIPLNHLAYGFARFASGHDLPLDWQQAITTIRKAIAAHPLLTSGSESYITRMMTLFGEKLYVKDGAEGVMVAALRDHGVGVAVKCDDGSMRGAEMMMTAMLDKIGLFDELSQNQKAGIQDLLEPQLFNANEIKVGQIGKSDLLKH